MSIFSGQHESMAETVYTNAAKYLAPHDGATHIIMLNSFSKLGNQNFDCDSKYTVEIDTVLRNMQKDGYQIVDVKFNSITGQGLTGNRTGFNTLITYK